MVAKQAFSGSTMQVSEDTTSERASARGEMFGTRRRFYDRILRLSRSSRRIQTEGMSCFLKREAGKRRVVNSRNGRSKKELEIVGETTGM